LENPNIPLNIDIGRSVDSLNANIRELEEELENIVP